MNSFSSEGWNESYNEGYLLANVENKKKFISILQQQYLEQASCQIKQADGDADVLIVKTAVESATDCMQYKYLSRKT